MHILLLFIFTLAIVAPSYAADRILGTTSGVGTAEELTPSEAASLIGSGTNLPTTTVATSESDPVKFYGTGGQATNGWRIGQGSDGNPFFDCYISSVQGNCDYYRKLNSGKKAGYKDSSNNIDFEYDEASGEISKITVNAETSGVTITMPFYWDMDMCGVSPTDGTTVSHVWNEDPLGSTPSATARVGTNRGTCVLNFPDSDGQYGVQISKQLPSGLTGSFDADIWWDTTGTGNARFQFATKCYADDEADDASMNTASVVTAAAGTSGRPNKQTITGITITGCAAGELMRIRFFRDRTEGSDTLNSSLNVEKIVFKGRTTK